MKNHEVKIVQNILAANDQVAEANRQVFNDNGVFAINIIASPGAGKTSLIIQTMRVLQDKAAVGVIEGDIAGSIDTEKVLAAGAVDAVQINTGGNCHLEAHMIQQSLPSMDLHLIDIVFIENVGNLICPNHWYLGENVKLCLTSAAEGHDKPVKYPDIFGAADVIVLNKIDLVELVDFDREFFYSSVRALNPTVPIFNSLAVPSHGMDAWAEWLQSGMQEFRVQTLRVANA